MIRNVIRSSASAVTRSFGAVRTVAAVPCTTRARVTCVATPVVSSTCIASSSLLRSPYVTSMVRLLSTAAPSSPTPTPLVLSEQKGNVLYITINVRVIHPSRLGVCEMDEWYDIL